MNLSHMPLNSHIKQKNISRLRRRFQRQGNSLAGIHSFQDLRLSKLIDKNGSVTGYEIRPLYYPFDLGLSDVLAVDYIPKGSKIILRIRLSKSVEEKISGDNGEKGFFGIE